MIIALIEKNLGNQEIILKILQEREKYNFTEINIIEFLHILGQEDIKKILQDTQKYHISNYVIANLVSLTKDEEIIKNWINNKDLYDFTDEELFIMIFSSKDEQLIENYIEQHNISILDIKPITLPDNMTIGIEIESEGKNSYTILHMQDIYNDWKSKDDVSLDKGVEVTSPILYGNKSTKDIYKVCERLIASGQISTKNCGGHIHIGADYLTTTQSYKNLIDLWTNTEKIMYLISNKSGELPREKVNLYAPAISNNIKKAITDGNINLETEEDLEKFTRNLQEIQAEGKKSSCKFLRKNYYGINFNNINNITKNTIEFRLANGTVDPEVIVKNINLFGGIIKTAQDIYIIQTLDEVNRTEEQKEKLKLFNSIINSDDELVKLDALLSLTVGEDKEYYFDRYNTNLRLLNEKGKSMEHIVGEISNTGTNLSSNYFYER